MDSELNFENKLREASNGFEPEVQGDWSAIERGLGNIERLEALRRAKMAERFAVGASVIVVGMALWMSVPAVLDWTLETSDSVADVIEMKERSPRAASSNEDFKFTVTEQSFQAASQIETSHANSAFPAAAKTSKLVLVDVEELMRPPTVPLESVTSVSDVNKSSPGDSENAGRFANERSSEPTALDVDGDVGVSVDHEVVRSELIIPSVSVQEACAGTSVNFELDYIDLQGSVLWNFGDGAFSKEASASHVFLNPGTYDITVSVRAHNEGIIRTRTVENMIVVRPKPVAKMDWVVHSNADGSKAIVKFFDETKLVSSSAWLLDESVLVEPQTELSIPGTYPVHLIASNAFGCQDVDTRTIDLGDRIAAGAPGMFSPNGDGRYDSFLPSLMNESESQCIFQIFDAEGRIIFESTEGHVQWNGELHDGVVARTGDRFHWTLEQVLPNGKKRFFSDFVRIEG